MNATSLVWPPLSDHVLQQRQFCISEVGWIPLPDDALRPHHFSLPESFFEASHSAAWSPIPAQALQPSYFCLPDEIAITDPVACHRKHAPTKQSAAFIAKQEVLKKVALGSLWRGRHDFKKLQASCQLGRSPVATVLANCYRESPPGTLKRSLYDSSCGADAGKFLAMKTTAASKRCRGETQ